MEQVIKETQLIKAEQDRIFEVKRLHFCAIRAKEQEAEGLTLSERQKYLIKHYL